MSSIINKCGFDPQGGTNFEDLSSLTPLQQNGEHDISTLVRDIAIKDFGYGGTSKYTLTLKNKEMVLELWDNENGSQKIEYGTLKCENNHWKLFKGDKSPIPLYDQSSTSRRLCKTLEKISKACSPKKLQPSSLPIEDEVATPPIPPSEIFALNSMEKLISRLENAATQLENSLQKESQEIQGCLKNLNKEIPLLTNTIESLSKEIEALKQANLKLQEDKASVKQSVEKSQAPEEILAKIEEILLAIQEIKANLEKIAFVSPQTRPISIGNIKIEINNINNNFKVLRKNVKIIQKEKLESQNAVLKEQKKESKLKDKQISDLKTQVETLQQESIESKNNIQSLQLQITEQERLLEEHQKEYQQLNEEKKELTKKSSQEISQLNQQLKQIKQEKEAREKERLERENKIKELEKQLSTAQKTNETSQTKIDEMQSTLSEKEEILKTFELARSELNKKIQEDNKRLQSELLRTQFLLEKAKEKEADQQNMLSEINKKIRNNSELNEEIKTKQEEKIKELQKTIQELEAQIALLKEERTPPSPSLQNSSLPQKPTNLPSSSNPSSRPSSSLSDSDEIATLLDALEFNNGSSLSRQNLKQVLANYALLDTNLSGLTSTNDKKAKINEWLESIQSHFPGVEVGDEEKKTIENQLLDKPQPISVSNYTSNASIIGAVSIAQENLKKFRMSIKNLPKPLTLDSIFTMKYAFFAKELIKFECHIKPLLEKYQTLNPHAELPSTLQKASKQLEQVKGIKIKLEAKFKQHIWNFKEKE